MIDVKTIDSMSKQLSDLKLQVIENNLMNTPEKGVFDIIKMLGNKLAAQNTVVDALHHKDRMHHVSRAFFVTSDTRAELYTSIEKQKMLQEIMDEINAILKER